MTFKLLFHVEFQLRGYPSAEIVGLNCRFLNHDCEMSRSTFGLLELLG